MGIMSRLVHYIMQWCAGSPHLPPLSFFLPAKLDQKALSRVLAVLELEFFDLLAQPISVAETWLVCSPVYDSSVYPSRILFGVVFLEYFAAVCY